MHAVVGGLHANETQVYPILYAETHSEFVVHADTGGVHRAEAQV